MCESENRNKKRKEVVDDEDDDTTSTTELKVIDWLGDSIAQVGAIPSLCVLYCVYSLEEKTRTEEVPVTDF